MKVWILKRNEQILKGKTDRTRWLIKLRDKREGIRGDLTFPKRKLNED